MQEVTVAAIGDILMRYNQIKSAKIPGKTTFSFDNMFREIAPYLQKSDLLIGNLETNFSGKIPSFQETHPKTGFPIFYCPDELALTLKAVRFDILTTANNHCIDSGVKGLKRTLDILDDHGISHTGTFRSKQESKDLLVRDINGIRIGVLAYTKGTNRIAVPKDEPWLVNIINAEKIIKDIRRLRSIQTDIVIICLHFGTEFRRYPNKIQINLVKKLFDNGADIILGSHPHVLQPIVFRKDKFAIYSLGNFTSEIMYKNMRTLSSIVLYITVNKNGVIDYRYLPVWVQPKTLANQYHYQVLPIQKYIEHPNAKVSESQKRIMKEVWQDTTSLFGKKHIQYI